ncbi:MAG: 4-hydroxybutyryl-CoA dehydratase [Candidatus Solincola sediminis]|uniref:4-hydroxybutyryl-CoA dehydratase n=1 Tax=Candidatus Solincola sediminis TaxID=1797199 RepID=A0A1F2WFA7_9ACTN|nr:MAG: 4-hydroxybutyryl-CoA dehydratase [Candidatus Solincola sediminis]OFW57782.1 MAG: 4-hydroxybutyryl-CoA dehydratase [Candidatus Solincola sediminis]
MKIDSAESYIESMRELKRKIYLLGDRVDNAVDHPMIRPSMNAMAETYNVGDEADAADLLFCESHLGGGRISRFTHIHQDTDDLVNKVLMQRLLGRRTSTCFQRCVGMDGFNALYSVTHECDQEHGTEYHERLKEYLRFVQEENVVVDGAMTDVKGDRNLRPSEQADPDLFVHVVERRPDGIVVRGAKAHQTGALNSHEILVMPTTAMREDEGDYAVSFAVPATAPGITFVLGRQPSDTRKMEGSPMDVGNPGYGSQEALIIFDDVFIPWERVFMCGEVDQSGKVVERFASYHRQSYGGCKVGVGDVLIGAAQLAAAYQGVERASHVRDKITEMIHLNETLFSCGIACSSRGAATPSGCYMVDPLLANVCKHNVTRFPFEISRLLQDIAGGLVVTMPSEKDFENPEVAPYLEKYLQGKDGVTTRDRMKIIKFIENMTMGCGAAAYLTESIHGAGSPQAQRIMISRLGNLPEKVQYAKRLAGIES